MDFSNLKSLRIPALRATTPEAPYERAVFCETVPIFTNLDFQILLVARITNISVIDLNVFRKNKVRST